jgi:catechol 2,3-dioxygenase-like lactoylglutathione lyase family enzyme
VVVDEGDRMSFRVLGTNHTSFTVSSLDRTVAFFQECLGFEVISKAPRDPALVSRITGVEGADMMIAFLKAPGHTLELIEYRAPASKGAVKARPCDTGFAHVAFNVDDAAAAVAKPASATACGRSRRWSPSTRDRTRAGAWFTCATGMA